MSESGSAIVALDTATDDVVAGAMRGAEVLYEESVAPAEAGRPRHGETALGGVERAVEAAGGWKRVGRLGIGIGPGSFTGLRIGIATGRALAQATGVPAVAVGTLGGLALGMAASADGAERPCLPTLDARRGEVFVQLHDARGRPLTAPVVLEPEDVGGWLARCGAAVAGHGAAPLAAGPGALRFARELEAAGVEVLSGDDTAHRLLARHLCSLAASGECRAPEGINPVYLREPDAKRWLERDRPDRS